MADTTKTSIVRLLVIIGIILVVDIIGGYIIGAKIVIPYFYGTEELVEESGESTDTDGEEARLPGLERALDSINLNPSSSNGEIFSCDIVLETDNPDVIEELNTRNYEIMDKLSTYLSFKTVTELNSPENWDQYRSDMLNIINSILIRGKVTHLHIPQKIIQFD